MKYFDPHIAAVARKLHLTDPDSKIILGSSTLSPKEMDEIGEKVSAFLHLVCSLLTRKFSGNHKLMAKTLGFKEDESDIISRFGGSLDPDVFARADLFKSAGRWRLLELNVGSMLGGIFIASLPRLAGIDQRGDVLEQWARIFSSKWPSQHQIAFVADSKHIPKMREPLKVLMSEISQYSRVDVVALGHREVQFDGNRLRSPDGKVIDVIYRYFDEHTITASPEEYKHIIESVSSGKTLCPMGPTYSLVSNKGILALLWDLVKKGELHDHEAKLVEELLPLTLWLSPANVLFALDHQNDLVLKPVNGLQGMNIICGREVDSAQWNSMITQAAHGFSEQKYVIQWYCESDISPMILEQNGTITQEDGRILWGAFVFGQKKLGAFLRAKTSRDTAVINIANGAAVGPWAG